VSSSGKASATAPARPAQGAGRRAFEAGLDAYERGDWKSARALLHRALEEDARKQDRARAAELLSALTVDRFVLRLAAILAAVLVAVFLVAA
jgi:hypothetical protein